MFIAHVFLFPAILGGADGRCTSRSSPRATTRSSARTPRQTERDAGRRARRFPGQAPRSLGLLAATAAVLFALGGLVQINPIWLWGPYETALGTNGAQPDWYLGWLIGGLRLVPGFDVTIGGATVVPNPFWGGALFPLVVLAVLALGRGSSGALTGDRGHTTCSTGRATRRCAPPSASGSSPGSSSSSSPAPQTASSSFLGLSLRDADLVLALRGLDLPGLIGFAATARAARCSGSSGRGAREAAEEAAGHGERPLETGTTPR